MTLSFAISAIAEPAPTLADRDRTFRPEPWSAHPSSRTNPASACWFAALEALYAERDGASSHVSAVAPNQVERLDAVLSNAAGSLRDRLGRPRGRRSSPASVPVAAKGLTEQRTRGSTPQPSQHLGPAGPVRVRGSDAKFSLCLVFGTKPLFARPALPANFRR
jgi:hypothetical protein